MGENRVDSAFGVGVQAFHLGAFGDESVTAAIAAIDGKGPEKRLVIFERSLVFYPGIDQARYDTEALFVEAFLLEESEDIAAVFQTRHVLHRYDDPIGRVQGILGEYVQFWTRIDDQDARNIRGGQESRQDHRTFDGIPQIVQGHG